MPSFLARYRTKTKRPISFRAKGRRISFRAKRISRRRRRVTF